MSPGMGRGAYDGLPARPGRPGGGLERSAAAPIAV
jgi:hypothetical protein